MAGSPWLDYQDTSYGGVEQSGPSQADILAASTSPITPSKYNNFETRSPRQILIDEANHPTKGDPNIENVGFSKPWEDYSQAKTTPKTDNVGPWQDYQAANSDAPPWEDYQQKPLFPGDPTAAVANWVKKTGQDIGSDPMGAVTGLAGGALSMIPQMGAIANAATPGGMAQNITNQMMTGKDQTSPAAILQQGNDATNQMIPPELQGPGYQAGADLVAAPFLPIQAGAHAAGEAIGGEAGKQVEASLNIGAMLGAVGLGGKGPVDHVKMADFADALTKDPEVMQQFHNDKNEATRNIAQTLLPFPDATNLDMTQQAGQILKDLQNRVDPTTGQPNPPKVSEVLDVLANHEIVSPLLQTYAKALQRRVNDLGLDNVQWSATKASDTPGAVYRSSTDAIDIQGPGYFTPKVMLHELTHAVTYGAIEFFNDVIKNGTDIESLSVPQQDMYRAVQGLQKVYDIATETAAKDHYMTKEAFVDKINTDEVFGNSADRYGFTNLHEFTAETLSGESAFIKKLDGMKLTNTEARGMGGTWTNKISSMWQAAKAAVKRVVLGDQPTVRAPEITMLDMAYDHATRVVDTATPEIRDINSRTPSGTDVTKSLSDIQPKVQEGLHDAIQYDTWHQIKNLLMMAASKEEFTTRLDAMSRDPGWKEFAFDYGSKLWNNAQHVVNTIGPHLDYQKLTAMGKTWTGDPRNATEFFGQELGGKQMLKANDFWDEGTATLGPDQLRITKTPDTLGGMVLKWFLDKSEDVQAMGARIYAEATAHMTEFHTLDRKGKENVMGQAIYFDDPLLGGKELRDNNLQWPTKEMLEKKGLTPEEVSAYQEMTKAVDYSYSLLNQALVKQGHEMHPQQPGYMPHIHEGPYKVRIELKNEQGTKVVVVKGYETKWGALAMIKRLEDGKWDGAGNTYRAQVDPQTLKGYSREDPQFIGRSLSTAMIDHFNAYQNIRTLDPAEITRISDIEATKQQGFTKHLLERHGVGGFLGDGGLKSGLLADIGLNRTNNKVLNLYDNYIKNVVEHYKNTVYVNEVLGPVYRHMDGVSPIDHGSYFGSLLNNTLKLKEYINEFAGNFTGQNINKLEFIDKDILMTLTDILGLSPSLLKDINRNMRNALSLTALRGNVGFYLGNIIQPGNVIALLELSNVMRRRGGESELPSALASFSKVMANRVEPSPEMQSALSWARDNHVLDAMLEYQMRKEQQGTVGNVIHTMTGGKFNPKIESIGKETSFMVAYQHMRDSGFNEVNSRTAAQHVMNLTMVNYDRSARPLMFQNYGMVGQAISPFAVYRNAFMGNMMLMMKEIIKNPAEVSAYKPMLMSTLFYLATAGVVGAPLVATFNQLVEWCNDLFPEMRLSNMQQVLLKSHVPDWVSFGMLSAGTKYLPFLGNGSYLGASLNSVALDDGIGSALVPFLNAIVQIGKVGVRQLASQATGGYILPSSASDIYAAGNKILPGVVRPMWQKAFQPDGTDVASKATSLGGFVERTPADAASLYATGRLSLEEYKARQRESAVDQFDKATQDAIKRCVQIAADNATGVPTGGTTDSVMQRAINLGATSAEFFKAVADEVENRRYTGILKDAGQPTVRGAQRRNLRNQMTDVAE